LRAAGHLFQARWVRWSLTGAVVAILLIAGLAWAMTGPLGRAVLVSLADGRSVAGYGVVTLEEVEGNVLSDFVIGRVELRDRDGLWLSVETARIQWRLGSIFSDTIEIARVEAGAIEVLRRPVRDTAARAEGGRAPSVRLDQLVLDDIRLSQDVVGPAANYTIHARLTRVADGALTAAGYAARIDAAGDRADFELTRTADGVLSGDLSITAPPAGLLSELLHGEGLGWTLDGQLNGTLQAGAGDYQLRLGETAASTGRLSWNDGAWRLDASLRPSAWPGFPEPLDALASDVELQGQGRVSPLTISAIDARSDALVLQAADLLSDRWRADLTLTETGTRLAQAYGVGLDAARVRARPVSAERGAAYALVFDLEGVSYTPFRADTLFGQISIETWDDGYRLQPRGQIAGLTASDPRLAALAGDQAAFDAVLTITSGAQAVNLERAAVQAEGWRAQAQGAWERTQPTITGTAQLDILDLEPLNLGVSGALSIEARTGEGGLDPDRLILTARSDTLTGPEPLASLLRGVEAQAQLDLTAPGLSLPVFRVRTDALALEGQAAQSAEGERWTASGDGLVDLAAVQAAGLDGQAAAAFDLTSGERGVTLRGQMQAVQLEIGEILITEPVLRAEARIVQGDVTGAWRVDAVARDEVAVMEGRFAVQGDRAGIDLETAQWGALRAAGAVQRTGARLAADLIASDATAGRAWAAELTYAGALSTPFEGQLAGGAQAQGWTMRDGYLRSARIEVDGPLSALAVNATAEGLWIDPFTLTASGELRVSETGVALSSDLEGRWNNAPIELREPISLSVGQDGFSLAAALTLDEADVTLRAARSAQTRAALRIANAPARWISGYMGVPPASGRWEIDTALEQTDGVWRGDLVARLDNIQPLDRSPDGALTGALNGEARLTLTDAARFDLQATAGALDVNARLLRPEEIRDLSTLLDPGWRGRVDVEGPVDTLAQLYLPVTELFTGLISAHAQFQPGEVSGWVEMSEGAYVSQTAGVRLSPFSLRADFDEDQLLIREARLGDGAGGAATASGAMGFTQDGVIGQAQVQFERFNAVTRTELFVQATGDAQLDLQGRRLKVTGDANLDRLSLTPTRTRGPDTPQIEVDEVNRPETLDPPYRRPVLIELDYRLRAEDSLFVSSRAYDSEWSADLQIEGPLNRLTLSGGATLQSGQASLLTRVFNMEEGQISFAGPINRTRILLQGRHQRAGLEAIARAEGPISQPRITFESIPSFPEDEVLARLLFDQDTAALSPLQTAQLAARLSGRDWLGALGEAGRRLGVDRLDLREGEEGQIAVRGGRRLGEDVYLELETSTAAALGAARIEWSITPDIVVLSRLTGDTDAQLAVRWRREFD